MFEVMTISTEGRGFRVLFRYKGVVGFFENLSSLNHQEFLMNYDGNCSRWGSGLDENHIKRDIPERDFCKILQGIDDHFGIKYYSYD